MTPTGSRDGGQPQREPDSGAGRGGIDVYAVRERPHQLEPVSAASPRPSPTAAVLNLDNQHRALLACPQEDRPPGAQVGVLDRVADRLPDRHEQAFGLFSIEFEIMGEGPERPSDVLQDVGVCRNAQVQPIDKDARGWAALGLRRSAEAEAKPIDQRTDQHRGTNCVRKIVERSILTLFPVVPNTGTSPAVQIYR